MVELLDEKYGYGTNVPANIVIEANVESEAIIRAIDNLGKFIEDEFSTSKQRSKIL